ncbi:uncharacterized protein LOC129790949 [Lutzomyia longipalpis]|uniref:uncharacterized protein LOC129790949 n=1 Tax=Lutzomyia longipalpis TaxID=7200 RepID=UPI002484545F|nr:uncharacterized protein LOC129790949 [Lutzomyia longipalpis]
MDASRNKDRQTEYPSDRAIAEATYNLASQCMGYSRLPGAIRALFEHHEINNVDAIACLGEEDIPMLEDTLKELKIMDRGELMTELPLGYKLIIIKTAKDFRKNRIKYNQKILQHLMYNVELDIFDYSYSSDSSNSSTSSR